MKKFFFAAAMLLLSMMPAKAQQVVSSSQNPGKFTSIEVSDYIHVTVKPSSACNVQISVTDLISEALSVKVKNETLCLEVNDKLITKENKDLMKGRKGVVPVADITVYMPLVKNITMHDKSFMSIGEMIEGGNVKVSLEDNAKLTVYELDCKNLDIDLKNKSYMDMSLKADDVTLDQSWSADSKISADCEELSAQLDQNATSSMDVYARKVSLKSSSLSSIAIIGSADMLSIETSGKGKVDASTFAAQTADCKMSCGSAWVKAQKTLTVDIDEGAYLVYDGAPVIDLVRIKNSTLLRPSEDKKKK